MQSLTDAEQILGVVKPHTHEVQQALLLRDQMASPNDNRFKHLGEAETLAVMTARFSDSVLMTDDRGARDIARAHGIDVASTWRLLHLICRAGLATESEVLAFLKDLRSRGAPVLNSVSALRSWMADMLNGM
ncbi:hypothetical protein [Mycolicibacterium fortuitum]|uniref:hypothetical protein n=1 Tax=Mycolicibacterium fortuitum TaxID=1766 RepID=UPI00148FDE5E|nr:hypothetical protein [Mycolicibacterium fortuitum]